MKRTRTKKAPVQLLSLDGRRVARGLKSLMMLARWMGGDDRTIVRLKVVFDLCNWLRHEGTPTNRRGDALLIEKIEARLDAVDRELIRIDGSALKLDTCGVFGFLDDDFFSWTFWRRREASVPSRLYVKRYGPAAGEAPIPADRKFGIPLADAPEEISKKVLDRLSWSIRREYCQAYFNFARNVLLIEDR